MSSSGRRVSPVVIVLAAGLGSVVAGCGLVVGSGDYVVGPAGDSGAVTVPPPDAGSEAQAPPPVDAAMPAPDASTEPDSQGTVPPADGGTTSDGGSTGACTANGTLVPGGLPTSDPAFLQRVNACILAVTCDPQFFAVSISDCITSDYLDAYFADKCLANLKSCDDYYACQGNRIATPTECPDSNDIDVGTCSASGVATSCFANGGGIVSNCAALGGTCAVFHESDFASVGDTQAGCQIVACTDTSSGEYQCAGTSQLFLCLDTDTNPIGIGQNCPAGTTCQTSNGRADCYETTSTCATPGTSCTNGNLTTCQTFTSDNQVFAGNCSVAGLSCDTTTSPAACTAPGCANSGCSETCNGNSLQLCIGGAPYTVDCTTLGFDTCANDFSHPDINFCTFL